MRVYLRALVQEIVFYTTAAAMARPRRDPQQQQQLVYTPVQTEPRLLTTNPSLHLSHSPSSSSPPPTTTHSPVGLQVTVKHARLTALDRTHLRLLLEHTDTLRRGHVARLGGFLVELGARPGVGVGKEVAGFVCGWINNVYMELDDDYGGGGGGGGDGDGDGVKGQDEPGKLRGRMAVLPILYAISDLLHNVLVLGRAPSSGDTLAQAMLDRLAYHTLPLLLPPPLSALNTPARMLTPAQRETREIWDKVGGLVRRWARWGVVPERVRGRVACRVELDGTAGNAGSSASAHPEPSAEFDGTEVSSTDSAYYSSLVQCS